MKTKKEKIERALANRLSRISAYSLVLVTMTFLGLYGGMISIRFLHGTQLHDDRTGGGHRTRLQGVHPRS